MQGDSGMVPLIPTSPRKEPAAGDPETDWRKEATPGTIPLELKDVCWTALL